MTALDLITSAARLIGVGASGEALSASEASDGLATLNQMMETWSNESLLISSVVSETFALTAGQASYTMGPGGNFNTSRAQKIENALVQVGSGPSFIDLPLHLLTQEQYAAIPLKSVQSTYPRELYADHAFSLDMLTFWPVPSASSNVVLNSWKPLAGFASLTSVLSLPPGYVRALRYNLAVDLAPEYGRALSDVVATLAAESKAVLKRMNSRPRYLKVDDALLSRSGSTRSGGMSALIGVTNGDGGEAVDGGTF